MADLRGAPNIAVAAQGADFFRMPGSGAGIRDSAAGETKAMQMRHLGTRGPLMSALGVGCMGISEFYGPAEV